VQETRQIKKTQRNNNYAQQSRVKLSGVIGRWGRVEGGRVGGGWSANLQLI